MCSAETPRHSVDPVRVLLVEDDGLIRDLLHKALVEWELCVAVESVANFSKALAAIALCPPDVLIIDLHLPDGTGLDLISHARLAKHSIKVMAMTGRNSAGVVRQVIDLQVDGFVEKSEDYPIWETAIREVIAGRRYFSPGTLQRLMQNREDHGEEISKLTSREMDILKLTGMGYSLRETAEKLRISEHTVKVHRQNIMKKLGLHDAVALTRFAIAKGISTAE